MCKSLSEGGQRCAASTKATLEKKSAAMRAAAETGDRARFHSAQVEWEQAAVDYASTPTGYDALKEHAEHAARSGDPRTAALLSSVIVRGEALREANEQVKIALAAARITETGLPGNENPVHEPAADENGAPLSEDDLRAWIAVLDELETQRASATEAYRVSTATNKSRYDIESARDRIKSWKEADADIAASATDDQALGRAVSRASSIAGGVSPTLRTAVYAQTRRAINHPNAAEFTFNHAVLALPLDEVVAHPRCPESTIATLSRSATRNLPAADWQPIVDRAATSPALTAVVAARHPDDAIREQHMLKMMGTQWDTATPTQLRIIAGVIQVIEIPDQQREMLDRSLTTWANSYADEETRDDINRASRVTRNLMGLPPLDAQDGALNSRPRG